MTFSFPPRGGHAPKDRWHPPRAPGRDPLVAGEMYDSTTCAVYTAPETFRTVHITQSHACTITLADVSGETT